MMTENKPRLLDQVKEKITSGENEPVPEMPKKFCVHCEKETATWAFCDQCGKLFWGRIVWELICSGVCLLLAAGMLMKAGGEFYEKALAVLIGAAGLWAMARLMRQISLFWSWRSPR